MVKTGLIFNYLRYCYHARPLYPLHVNKPYDIFMKLTERQKKFLRQQAHSLKPVITTGDKGITDGLVDELNGALEHHELLKVKIRVGDRDARDEMIEALLDKSDTFLVSRVGNVAALYRPKKKNPKIVLPKAG